MSKIGYYIIYGILWLLTLPPFWFLYIISDIMFFFVYHIIGYRKKVVLDNLKNALPEKNEQERKQIARKFYRHLCDFFIESLKTIHISKKQLDKRFVYKNPGLINNLYKKDKHIILISGHYANWEWMINLPEKIQHTFLTVVKPLENRHANKIISNLRGKFGVVIIPMKDTLRALITHIKNNEKVMLWLLGDQRPPKHADYWTTFLNQEAAVFLGAEKMAKKFDAAVVFLDIKKVKRGHYEVQFIKLFENAKETERYEITETHTHTLENIIRKRPEYWLWSHKRWKHKKPEK